MINYSGNSVSVPKNIIDTWKGRILDIHCTDIQRKKVH